MKLGSQYIRLREFFTEVKESEEISVTVDELAEVLDCTHRNVMLLLHRMGEREWLQWKPKRGRGNRSVLIFLIPVERLILELAKQLVGKKDLRGALDQINRTIVPLSTKESFNHWLYQYFGYTTEVKNQIKLDTLRLPLNGPLHTLDPMFTNFASEAHIVRQIFDNLVHYNAVKDSLEPLLAHYWETSSDRTVWTFYLRKGVLFHHGREMTADDVYYSFMRPKLHDEKTLFRWVYSLIHQIKVIDSTTIQIELSQPNELFLPFLSTNRAVIVPQDVCNESLERFGKTPIGTGPFKIVRNDRSMCVLEAFPHYFQGRAHLDRVEIWNIPDLYEREHRNDLADFQIMHNVKGSDQSAASLNQVKESGTSCKFITFNSLKAGAIQLPRLRQTLRHILDSHTILPSFHLEDIDESYGFINSSDTLPDKAHRLSSNEINDVQQTTGDGAEHLVLCTIPHYEKDAQVIQALCRQADIEVTVNLLTPEQFKGPKRLEADMILFALLLDNDMELRLVDLYTTMKMHLDFSTRKTLEGKIEKILAEPTTAHRKILFREIEGFLMDMHWIHFLYQKQQNTVYQSSVKGIPLDSLDPVLFKNIWIKS